ncbi:MAG: LysM peptidoglycan-binding domain-containing protein [Caldilineae bacterium]|nr:MAG: LysM peptidoglycan-binding domain-containing protein [Caldilineae bacterium]
MKAVTKMKTVRVSLLIGVLVIALLLTALPGVVSAAPAERSADAPAASYYIYHTVRYGETLSQIAVRYGTTVQVLMQINGISNPNHIYVGQVLRIPAAAPGCVRYHRVTYGQTLSGIAAWYGVSVYALAQANGLTNLNRVYAGQVLCIPSIGGPVYPKPVYGAGFWYTVQYGDTLARIAYRYGATIYAIMAANGLGSPNRILVGQRLWIPGYQAPSPAPTPAPSPPPTQTGGPWTGLYYNNKDFSGAPAMIRQDGVINFDWGSGSPDAKINSDNFSVLWTATNNFSAGTYQFVATSDDGVRVYVDDHKIIDGWSVHPATDYVGEIYLPAGNHVVRVEFFEEGGLASIYVRWMRK